MALERLEQRKKRDGKGKGEYGVDGSTEDYDIAKLSTLVPRSDLSNKTDRVNMNGQKIDYGDDRLDSKSGVNRVSKVK